MLAISTLITLNPDMPINIPIELLRSFVAIAEAGSVVKATERVFVTQSALSLQMKRLAEITGTNILERNQGVLQLTAGGEKLLMHARRILELNDAAIVDLKGAGLSGPIRIGLVQDFADEILGGVLARFYELNPNADLRISVGNSADLQEKLHAGLLDIAAFLTMAVSVDRNVPLIWLGEPGLLSERTLPVALMAKPCLFRDAALEALDRAGRPYRVIVETQSLSVVRATVQAGLAVTCRTPFTLSPPWPRIEGFGAELPSISYCVDQRSDLPQSMMTLAGLVRDAVDVMAERQFS